jgi:hypothetical protein
VGAAVNMLETTGQFARGETIIDAFLGLIPRVIWPNKPIRAGSGDLVTRFTGIEFAEGTSVGIGQVMEFYGNFGREGVVIGLFLIGLVVGTADRMAGWYLAAGDWKRFAAWYLPALGMLQTGGSLFELLTSTVAAGVSIRVCHAFVIPMLESRLSWAKQMRDDQARQLSAALAANEDTA